MSHWTISECERIEGPDGRDSTAFKWWLARDGVQPTFVFVEVANHLLNGHYDPGRPTDRSVAAAQTEGRSEVERCLTLDRPPRLIRAGTVGDPVVTPR